jgi:uncharacterized membrane protein
MNVAILARAERPAILTKKGTRIESIDLLRGVIMIIMAIDHVRDYFHYDAFYYSPTDLTQTSPFLFFTRFITHYCAPVFVFLAGLSGYLSGTRTSKKERAIFLLKRGLWLILVELLIIVFFRTFNPTYPYVQLQVIWAIGISMIVLSALVFLKRIYIVLIGALLVGGHNLLDSIHMQGNDLWSFLWAVLHESKHFQFGHFHVYVQYPVLPWIGIMAMGYCCGSLYNKGYSSQKRKRLLLSIGLLAITLFVGLRSNNLYGDPSVWSPQKSSLYSLLSFINVTKYPPSLLYCLITIGPALIFLSVSEKPLSKVGKEITIFGGVPMFYYLAHILLIHVLAAIAGAITGYPEIFILSNRIYDIPALRGYGFNLATVYLVWAVLIIILYPFCKWFNYYKKTHEYWWLSYL